jgi:fermentation-respiration switch protein FrsA (DUF1100 family)
MGHGFAGTRELFLDRYAERFRARGLAVLVFDYRHFGESAGEPRQLVDPDLQLEDWRAALALVRSRSDLDGERVGLWGTSFSGGHVLVIAAGDPAVRAVTAQVPFVDAREGEGAGWLASLRAGWAVARDVGRGWVGRAPLYIPVIGRPGELAAITAPGSYEAFLELVPPQAGWRNEVVARSLWNVASYRPTRFASRIRAPLLLIAARRDTLVPLAAVARVASRAPDARLLVVEGGHFDGYAGARFEEVVAAQAEFLAVQLLGQTADPGSAEP